MRRFFLTSCIALILVISTAGAPPAVHAQNLACQPGCIPGSVDGVNGCVSSDNTTKFCDSPTGTAAQLTAQANTNANDANPPLSFKAGGIFADVMTFLMSIFAWLLGVAIVTLDYAVLYTVVHMGSYVKELPAIGVAWRILRDIGNITLIFGFLAVGITTILNVDWYGDRKKFLPMLLVAAVFLNFSLFISEAVIDTGNLFATQFYTQINGGIPAGNKSISNESISGKIMSQLGLQTLYGQALDAEKSKELFKADNIVFIGILGILLFIVAAFVMFSLAFILIARFVALIFLIILAPIGFAGLAVPQLASMANKWWSTLFSQTITAPVLLLLLYTALLVITDTHFLFSGSNSAPDYLGFIQNASGGFDLPGFASILLSFLVAMGLLLVVVIKAKSMSAFGAGLATKAASRLSGATILAAGAAKSTRWVGRNTLGRAGTTKTGKFLGMGGLATKTFDFRNSKLAKTAQTRTGLDLGTGGKGGYKTIAAEQQKSDRKKLVGTSLEKAEGAEAAATKAHSQLQTQHETATTEYTKQKAEVERLEAINKSNREKGIFNQQNTNDLKTAQQNLATSKESFDAVATAMAGAKATLKRTQEAAERMREKMDKIEERSEIQELKDALREGAAKASTERGTEKKEAKAEEKK